MNYTLAILTHGPPRTLARTIQTFRERADVEPSHVRVFADAVDPIEHRFVIDTVCDYWPDTSREIAATAPVRQMGFCGATERLWKLATGETIPYDLRSGPPDYVFWLEHDFVFLRDLQLEAMAAVLDDEEELLAQISLIRDAVNETEARAGGLVASKPGAFERVDDDVFPWMRQRAYFTTNPSLMRREFMFEHPFPGDPPYCEGRYGLDLVADGYTFGAWGHGEEWVAHMGVRTETGRGY